MCNNNPELRQSVTPDLFLRERESMKSVLYIGPTSLHLMWTVVVMTAALCYNTPSVCVVWLIPLCDWCCCRPRPAYCVGSRLGQCCAFRWKYNRHAIVLVGGIRHKGLLKCWSLVRGSVDVLGVGAVSSEASSEALSEAL